MDARTAHCAQPNSAYLYFIPCNFFLIHNVIVIFNFPLTLVARCPQLVAVLTLGYHSIDTVITLCMYVSVHVCNRQICDIFRTTVTSHVTYKKPNAFENKDDEIFLCAKLCFILISPSQLYHE